MELGDELGHLSYSTLVHALDTRAEMGDSLRNFVPVLPAHLKTGDIIDFVSRELEFVRDELVG